MPDRQQVATHMTLTKTVKPANERYRFGTYVSKRRWASIWHQLDEVLSLQPTTVLEIGPGPGIFKTMARLFGVRVETVDTDSTLHPDHVASVIDLPMPSNSVDVVGCFEVLEHIPYKLLAQALAEIYRVTRRSAVISLPDARPCVRLRIPHIGKRQFLIEPPFWRSQLHRFDGEHYWEINKRGYHLSVIVQAIMHAGFALVRTYRVWDNPYHRMFVLRKQTSI